MKPQTPTVSRRALLAGTTASLAAASILAQARRARAAEGGYLPGVGQPYRFEVERTEAEWRAQLTEAEYAILRESETEFPTTSPYWNTDTPGIYHCRGCALPLYSSEHYSPQDIGFVFFEHADPNAVLTGIHRADYNGALDEPQLMIEVHCRRCGGHLGHILRIGEEVLHCINGTALELRPAAA